MSTVADPAKARRVELILRQIDSLPTLPAIATKLLSLTTRDDSHVREVIDLVSSDQALTAKILSLCRRAYRGVRNDVLTIEKAVLLLGFNAIRSAVLSLKVFEVFDAPRPDAWRDPQTGQLAPGASSDDDPIHGPQEPGARFDRANFWRHCLAVGIASELIVAAHPNDPQLTASEAFVCGLLHDVGKLALDYMLPKSFARVIELTELNQGNISNLERRIIGLDHHTAGKRLAEQWQLPDMIRDCIWLHGSTYDSVPKLPHRRMIGLVSLADLLARRNHLGYSGNFSFNQTQKDLAEALGFKPHLVESVTNQLHEELIKRESVLGLEDKPSREIFLQSIQQANQVLGRLNTALERRNRTATNQARILDAVTLFQSQITPDRSVQDVIDQVVLNASQILGQGFYAVLYQPQVKHTAEPQPLMLCEYSAGHDEPGPPHIQYLNPPGQTMSLADLRTDFSMSLSMMGFFPWLANYLSEGLELWEIKMLPLTCGWGTVAVILHTCGHLPARQQLQAVTGCWGSAIGYAAQQESTVRLGEELAEANRALSEAQDRLVRTASMVRLGEMAAGAAHEMNNPLAVISGRSQLLTMSLSPGSKEQQAAQTIFEQSHRLSDLITLLRLFADPPKLELEPTDIGRLLDDTIKRVRRDLPQNESMKPISLQVKSGLPQVSVDGEQLAIAVKEVLLNAIQAMPKKSVYVIARADPEHRNLVIQVKDDGKGMDEYTRLHATDPFFSAKAAGRQIGMGLARVDQIVAAHGGQLEIRSILDGGTVVTLSIPLDSPL